MKLFEDLTVDPFFLRQSDQAQEILDRHVKRMIAEQERKLQVQSDEDGGFHAVGATLKVDLWATLDQMEAA